MISLIQSCNSFVFIFISFKIDFSEISDYVEFQNFSKSYILIIGGDAAEESEAGVCCRNCDTLARLHPLPHEDASSLHFAEDEHRYTCWGRVVQRSVTALISGCFPDTFDAEAVTDKYLCRWAADETSKYYGVIQRVTADGGTAAPGGRIKYDAKPKKPGSVLHARTIQRKIQAGEHLMCSSCYQKQNNDKKVHHAVPALATAWVHSSHCGVHTVRATGGG